MQSSHLPSSIDVQDSGREVPMGGGGGWKTAGFAAQEIPGLVTVAGSLSLPPLIQIQVSKQHSKARAGGKQLTGPQAVLTTEHQPKGDRERLVELDILCYRLFIAWN